MQRKFYLAIEAMRPFCQLQEKPLIELIFKKSDVKEHLMDKLFTTRNRFENPTSPVAIFNFYETLDSEHQFEFDEWFNMEIEKVNARTVQHQAILAGDDDPAIKRLKATLLMVREELIFGGDWETAKKQIDKALLI